MHESEALTVVLVLSLSLVAGAATRWYSRKTRFPYTLAMLLLGLAAGYSMLQLGEEDLFGLMPEAGFLTPELIIFVFLPALVFESAFSLDTYAFRKQLGTIAMMAVPALIIGALLTASLMVAVTASNWQWGWLTALIFGALISATDPVAVVAVLREVGAPKRLTVLLEGESLLNDGTAIVFFAVLLELLTGTESGNHGAGGVLIGFVTVVSGGIAVGLIVAGLFSSWISRTFNDPLVEITLTLVMAYAAMVIAEGFLHVSGVMAVVTAGLWMSGFGRTQVSPEVTEFLHQFWELLSYVANTLIFLLVGLVIADQIGGAAWEDVLVIGASFLGLILIRFSVIVFFRPVIRWTGDSISWGESTVMGWGGLRGAVSLALALAIFENALIPEDLRRQFLLLTAGIVLLTILVNGGSIAWLLRKLGYDRLPPGQILAQATAQAGALRAVRDRIGEVRHSRILPTVPWTSLEEALQERIDGLHQQIDRIQGKLKGSTRDRVTGYWRQALEIERQSYWGAYDEGTLGSRAVRILNHEIDVQLDRLRGGDTTAPDRRTPKLKRLLPFLSLLFQRLGLSSGAVESGRLSLLYDLARSETSTASQVLRKLSELETKDPETFDTLEETYRHYQLEGKAALEDMRSNLPEITRAIETRLANRIQLNFEREAYRELGELGALDERTAHRLLADVEHRMTRLRHEPPELSLPSFQEICRATPLLAALDEATIRAIEQVAQERVLSPGEVLIRQGEHADTIYILARGALHVLWEKPGKEPILYDILGGGDIVGEIAMLTGGVRTATVRSATSVTLFQIERQDFLQLMQKDPGLEEKIWQAFTEHTFDTLLRKLPRFESLDHAARLMWLKEGEVRVFDQAMKVPLGEGEFIFLVWGTLKGSRTDYPAPALLTVDAALEQDSPVAEAKARIVVLDAPFMARKESEG